MSCTNCTNSNLVSIQLTIAAEEVALLRCPRCDHRMWSGREGTMSRDGVLELVRSAR